MSGQYTDQDSTQLPSTGEPGPVMKLGLALSLLLIVTGLLSALMSWGVGGLLVAAGLGLMASVVGVHSLRPGPRRNPWSGLVLCSFGFFMFWIIVKPFILIE